MPYTLPEKEAFSLEELQKHNKEDDCWIAIDGAVYDISKFAGMHPGGETIMYEYAGQDVSEVFWGLHRVEVLEKYGPKYHIGHLAGGEVAQPATREDLSSVPYAEVPALRGRFSPYYDEGHKNFRLEIRKWVKDMLLEEAEEFEPQNKAPSDETFRAMGDFGLLAARIGPGAHLHYVKSLPGGVTPENFTYFHEGIAHEEVARLGVPGYCDGLGAGLTIGLPPVLNFGPDWMKEKVGREVLSGKKRICLAISEAFAGSDVAGMKSRAHKSDDGKFYIVNGTKKWITGGCQADFFTTAVRTGGNGAGGVSLLLIERDQVEGFETKAIKTSYSSGAGTAYITMEDTQVPVENLIGQENGGFLCIMYNFNHERWMIICYMHSSTRGALEECFKWANQRKVFGKPLSAQPLIRWKLANMAAQVESTQAWLETITYQMSKYSYAEGAMELAGDVSLLKFQCTRVGGMVADEAVQIFGGRGITQTGMGRMIERFNRVQKFGAILGGSEEIMADLGIRMAMKTYPDNARL